jgi:chromosome partitioning protein
MLGYISWPMTQIIAVANHKGGVGKTATAHSLGVGLAGLGRRVLLVDLDPQSSLTMAAGVKDAAGESLAEVLGGATPGHLGLADILVSLGDNLALAPADIALAAGELGMAQRLGRETLLYNALASVNGRFDVVLIDCPPSLGMLTINALRAATAVIIPTQPQASDLRGLALFLETLGQVKAEINPGLVVVGIVVTFADGRLIHHQDAIETMKRQGLPLFRTVIGRSVRVAEAAAAGETVITYDPDNPQAANYKLLAEELNEWLKSGQR